MSGKFALIIANSDYTDPKLAKLTAPGKDAEAFATILKAPDVSAFDEVSTLINQTEPTARRAIAKFFANRKPDDLLLLYFSGHGVRDEQGRLFLATTDTDHTMLDATAIPAEFVTREMDNSRSKREVLILDCCNSGAFAYGTKGESGASMGTASAFEGTGYGHVVLTATDNTQFAWEGDQIIGDEVPESLFTHFLIKGLEGEADDNGDSIITVDELYDYAFDQIVNRTPDQKPGKWAYKEQGKIVLTTKVRPGTVKPLPLDADLEQDLQSTRNYVREGAVKELGNILNGNNLGKALSAELKLRNVADNDDSYSIRQMAAQLLEKYQARKGIKSEPEESFPATIEKPVIPTIEKPLADNEGKPPDKPKLNKWILGTGILVFIGWIAGGCCILYGFFANGTSGPIQASNPTSPPIETPVPVEVIVTNPASAGKIVYTCQADKQNDEQICLINADGTGQRQLTSNSYENYYASLSPDGNSVVFASNQTGNFEIYEMDLNGSQRKLTSGIGELAAPEISPDGLQIVFTNNYNTIDHIWVMDRDGKNPHEVYGAPDADAVDPSWSPDGHQILFELGSGENKLINVINADGSGLSAVNKSFLTRGRSDWSPDGTTIAAYSGVSRKREIYIMNIDGSNLRQISKGGNAQGPSFSPDGNWIAYTAYTSVVDDNSCEIFIMKTDGSEINQLTNNNYCDYQPRWGP